MTKRPTTEPEVRISEAKPPRGWRGYVLLLAGLIFLTAALNLGAQTGGALATGAQNVSSNRFLFVVDTSAGMKRHLTDVLSVAQDIIRSSANGQLHNGDTIGVWTFNETIYTGNLPLQEWAAEDSEEIALRMTEFFRQQPFEKRSRLDLAMTGVSEIVKHSDIITIFIVSDGSSPMQGTPFDQQINATYQQTLQGMKKERRPIVTVLQAKGGRFIRYTVNAVPWPVVIPEVPIPIRLAGVAPAAAGIVATNAAGATAPNPLPAPPIIPPPTNAAMPAVATTQPASQPPVAIPAPASVTPSALPPQIPPVIAPMAIQTAPAVSNAATIVAPPAMPVSMTPRPGPVAVKAQMPGTPAAPPRSASLELPRPAVTTNMVVAQNHLAPAPAPAPVRVPEPAAKSAPVEATAPPATAATNAAPARSTASLVAQGTALMRSFAGAHPKMLLIGGGTLIVIALGLIVMLVRRSRRTARISLISQMMDDRQQ
jgi:hypothetical protein